MSNDSTVTKPKPVRGPNGRFMSKKELEEAKNTPSTHIQSEQKPDEMDTTNVVSIPEDAPLPEVSPSDNHTESVESELIPSALVFFDDLAYYGEHVRRAYRNKQWFFVLEDLFPLANITEPVNTINLYKSEPYYKDALNIDVFEVDIPRTNVGLSSITLGNENAVANLISLLRHKGHFFPGQFPEWIHNISQIDYEEACLARTQSLSTTEN